MARGTPWGLLMAAMLVAAPGAQARTWRVEKDGSGDYKAIQPAIDGASAGDTIQLGVGRWTEYAPLNSQGRKWIENVYVHVTVDSLTIRGAGADQSIIGPTTVIQPPTEWPKGICTLYDVQRLRVEDLTVEHIREGLYFSKGLLEVDHCIFRGGVLGIASWGERGNVIRGSQFYDNHGGAAIIGWQGCGGFIVSDCTFSGNDYGVDFYTLGALVENCIFSGGGVGAQFTMGAIGTIRNCVFDESISNFSLFMRTDAQVQLEDNQIRGGGYKVFLDAGAVVSGSRNVFTGGGLGTFLIHACVPNLHGNHILHGMGPTIMLDSFAPPFQTIDMTGNYWGTENPDSIAAWIHDGHDDPTVSAYVQFEPFSTTPLQTEKKSMGGLKALYR